MNIRIRRSMSALLRPVIGLLGAGLFAAGVQAGEPLIHDAEYYICLLYTSDAADDDYTV